MAQLSPGRCCCQRAPPTLYLCRAMDTIRYLSKPSLSRPSEVVGKPILHNTLCHKACIETSQHYYHVTTDTGLAQVPGISSGPIGHSDLIQADITIHPMGRKYSHEALIKIRKHDISCQIGNADNAVQVGLVPCQRLCCSLFKSARYNRHLWRSTRQRSR